MQLASMDRMQWRRNMAVAAFGVLGAAAAFTAGAKLGSTLDHQTHQTTVAKVPVDQLAPPSREDAAPPSAVASKK